MKNKVYHIKIHSITRFIISFIVLLVGLTTVIPKVFFIANSYIFDVFLFLLSFSASFYIAYLISLGKVSIIFSEKTLSHKWQKRFFLSLEKDYEIPWNSIESYYFEPDRAFDSFVINFKNKTRYRISQMNIFPIKDDFERLTNDFPRIANQYKTESGIIAEGSNIYASKHFLWLYYLLLILAIFIIIISLINSEFRSSWGVLGLIGTSIIFYRLMIKKYRHNN